MGFREIRLRLIQLLEDGRYKHEERAVAGEKNLLATGQISSLEVIALLRKCRGDQYQTSRHHFDTTQIVHIFKPNNQGVRWYIKSYLIETDGVIAVFISVHK